MRIALRGATNRPLSHNESCMILVTLSVESCCDFCLSLSLSTIDRLLSDLTSHQRFWTLATMERHEMHPLKRAIVGNPQPTPTEFAKGSNSKGVPIKNGFTEQAKPKVRFWRSIKRTENKAKSHSDFSILHRSSSFRLHICPVGRPRHCM